jgi:hypothetical protein
LVAGGFVRSGAPINSGRAAELMERRWGPDGAKEICNSATLALVMGGGKESHSLQGLSRLAGEYDPAQGIHHRRQPRTAGRSRTSASG